MMTSVSIWKHNGHPTKSTNVLVNDKFSDLLVFGYTCKLFKDEARAESFHRGEHLIPWQSDPTLLIDRYDCRMHLTDLAEWEKPGTRVPVLSEAEKQIEKICEEERYLDLKNDILEEQLYREEEMKRLQASLGTGGSEIGFQYDEYNPAEPTEAGAETEQTQEEVSIPYKLLPNVRFPPDTIMPKWMKEHAVIEKTAMFVWTQGPQMEIVIKAKQSANRQFDFLNMEHPLNSYYRYLLKLMKEKKYIPPTPPPPEVKKVVEEDDSSSDEEGGGYLHPSLLGRLQSRPEESYVRTPDREVNYKLGDTNDVYSQLFKKLSAIAPKAPPRPPTPPSPVTREVEISKNSAGYEDSSIVKTDMVRTKESSIDENFDESKMLEWYQISTGVDFGLLAQSAIPPPPDLQPIVDRLAEYVARNGAEFEEVVRKRQDRNFDFINIGHMYHGYYQMKIAEVAYMDYVQQINAEKSNVGSTDCRMSSSPALSASGSIRSVASNEETHSVHSSHLNHSDDEHDSEVRGENDGEELANPKLSEEKKSEAIKLGMEESRIIQSLGLADSPVRDDEKDVADQLSTEKDDKSRNKANQPISFALKSAPKKKVPVPSEEVAAKLQGEDSDEDDEDFVDANFDRELNNESAKPDTFSAGDSHDPTDPIAVLTSKNPELYRKHSDILFKLHQMKHSLKLKPTMEPVMAKRQDVDELLDVSLGGEEEDDEAKQLRIFMLQAADRLKQIRSKKKPKNDDSCLSTGSNSRHMAESPNSCDEIPPEDPLTSAHLVHDLDLPGTSSDTAGMFSSVTAQLCTLSAGSANVSRKGQDDENDKNDPLKNAVQTARRKKAAMFLSLLKSTNADTISDKPSSDFGSTANSSLVNSVCGSPAPNDGTAVGLSASSRSSSRSTSSEPEPASVGKQNEGGKIDEEDLKSRTDSQIVTDCKGGGKNAETEQNSDITKDDKAISRNESVIRALNSKRVGSDNSVKLSKKKKSKKHKRRKKVISMFDEDSEIDQVSDSDDSAVRKSKSHSKSQHHKSSKTTDAAAASTSNSVHSKKNKKHRSKRKSMHSGDEREESSGHRHKKAKRTFSNSVGASHVAVLVSTTSEDLGNGSIPQANVEEKEAGQGETVSIRNDQETPSIAETRHKKHNEKKKRLKSHSKKKKTKKEKVIE